MKYLLNVVFYIIDLQTPIFTISTHKQNPDKVGAAKIQNAASAQDSDVKISGRNSNEEPATVCPLAGRNGRSVFLMGAV